MVDTVGSHHVAIVSQKWLDETVVALEENEQHGQVLLYKEITERVYRRLSHCVNILGQGLALVLAVLLARQPGYSDAVEIGCIDFQTEVDLGAYRRFAQFG